MAGYGVGMPTILETFSLLGNCGRRKVFSAYLAWQLFSQLAGAGAEQALPANAGNSPAKERPRKKFSLTWRPKFLIMIFLFVGRSFS